MHKEIKVIATHSGKFHADDLFGVAALKLLFSQAKVVRSRDPDVLKSADARVDVGGVHDPASGGFDHRQAGFTKLRENGIPFASFGLVWEVFGAQVCASQEIADRIDEKLVQPIDAIDNGVDMCSEKHVIWPFNISHMVAMMNPPWNSDVDHDEAFMKAMEIAMYVLDCVVKNHQASAEADKFVQQKAEEFEGKPYVILEEYLPTGYLVEYTNKEFVVYPDTHGNWTIKSLPADKGGFEPRRMLPESWAGLSGAQLAKVTGVPDAIFCHRGRWICSAKSKEGVLKMLELALKRR